MTIKPSLEKIVEAISALMAEMESQAFVDERFAELSMRQMLYLNTILRLEHPNFSDLARELGVTKPSVTAIVSTLIRKGYVEKVQDGDDRRAYHIVPTRKAEEFDKIHAATHKRLADFLAAQLDPNEVEQLTQLLSKVLQGMQR
jgi:DNA-binding MarR family transcriptional regulator